MKKWNKNDVGKKISVCVRESPLADKLIYKKIIIYDVNTGVPNKVGFVEDPISLDATIYPPYISSKIGLVGIVKSQKKESEKYLTKSGDWCFLEKVSKDEMDELKRIAKPQETYQK